jgi:hypothetical protein
MFNFSSTSAMVVVIGLNLLLPWRGHAAESLASPTRDPAGYVGATTCQSSMCHGGASPSRSQFVTWIRDDFHSRAYATLVTPRSTRIAESLGILSATQSARCTTCHAPYEAIPVSERASTVQVDEGVSCEDCHNPAESWLRGHTRPDWSYADRVHAGLRDLRSAYARANTCVACHQVIDPALLQAGHPELTFELDGQTASEPRHWTEKVAWFGPKAWLVGQAAALREISLQLARSYRPDPDLADQQQALIWLLQQMPVARFDAANNEPPSAIAARSDGLARTLSAGSWSLAMTLDSLRALTATADSFQDTRVPNPVQERRAERLVLALDRLSKSAEGSVSPAGQDELAALFAAVQNRDRFDAKDFSRQLRQFAGELAPAK